MLSLKSCSPLSITLYLFQSLLLPSKCISLFIHLSFSFSTGHYVLYHVCCICHHLFSLICHANYIPCCTLYIPNIPSIPCSLYLNAIPYHFHDILSSLHFHFLAYNVFCIICEKQIVYFPLSIIPCPLHFLLFILNCPSYYVCCILCRFYFTMIYVTQQQV